MPVYSITSLMQRLSSRLRRGEEVLTLIAQQALLHLAHSIARQLIHEENPLRHLVVGKLLLAGRERTAKWFSHSQDP
jgi:hypothetical protein